MSVEPLDLLRRWAAAKREYRELKRQRSALACEYERTVLWVSHWPPVSGILSEAGEDRVTRERDERDGRTEDHPCWWWDTEGNSDGDGHPHGEHYGDSSDRGWCDSCRERQRIHEALPRAQRRMASLTGALYRAGVKL